MRKVIGFIAVVLFFGGLTFPNFVCAKNEDPFEEWANEHSVRVLVIERFSYHNGHLLYEVVYTGNELRTKFNVDKLSKEKKMAMSIYTLKLLFPNEVYTLAKGRSIEKSHYKTTILTTSYEPYPWWENEPYLPRWTWEYIGKGIYEKADPVDLVWENTRKYRVKRVLRNVGWLDYVLSTPQYIYDPPEYGGRGWEKGDDIATSFIGIPSRYHMRLWVIYNKKIVGAAHYEEWNWLVFTHVIESYEMAEDKVASYYTNSWSVNFDFYELDNYIQIPFNDGSATKISKG